MAKKKLVIRPSKPLKQRIFENWELYLFFLFPGILITFIFKYIPIYGIQLAFRDYSPRLGFWKSPWVGLKNFRRFFDSPNVFNVIKNTVILSLYGFVAGYPMPIILAVLVNNFRHKKYGKIIQTITYIPNFISTIIMCGMIIIFLSPRIGMVNGIMGIFGIDPIHFMAEIGYWRNIYVWTGVWQGMGWSSIVYFAALSNVSVEMQEAAVVDGATKLQRIIHIDLPTIAPMITLTLIMAMGGLLSVGFEKTFALQNPLNLEVSEVIATYTYKVGIVQGDMPYGAAIGLLNSAVNSVLLIGVNSIARKVSDYALW